MYESRDEAFLAALAKCPGCVLDYCIMKNDGPETGIDAHRAALAFAMGRVEGVTADVSRAKGRLIPASELLALPEKPWKRTADYKGTKVTVYEWEEGRLPYWRAFLAPPHGGVRTEDFQAVNAALFPRGTDSLEAYEWSADWSDYFDDGHEWWGAACWSVRDLAMDRYIVILASATD